MCNLFMYYRKEKKLKKNIYVTSRVKEERRIVAVLKWFDWRDVDVYLPFCFSIDAFRQWARSFLSGDHDV